MAELTAAMLCHLHHQVCNACTCTCMGNTSCIYWCWCSVLGGFITPADSSSTSLGIGLSIALKAERGIPDLLWGAVAQWSEHLQLKQEALSSIPSGCPGFFSLSAGLY